MTCLISKGSKHATVQLAIEPEVKTGTYTRLSMVDTAELAFLTDTSKSTWEKKRMRGEGPPYLKTRNLVRYRLVDVEQWISEHQVYGTEVSK